MEGNIQIMDLKNRENISNFSFHNQKITSLHFVNGHQLVASSDSTVKLIDFHGKIPQDLFKKLGTEKLNIQVNLKHGNITDMELNGGNFVICIFFKSN
jgi:WD40 repeat protein